LVLVHSPLTGSGVWNLVAAELGRAGYEPDVPDLTPTVEAGPPYCARLARTIARRACGRATILIGHSRAGPLLAAAAAMAGEAAVGCVFVDARLPAPGHAWIDTVPPGFAARLRALADPQGWLPPWPRWWDEEEMVRILTDPAVRQDFTASCPRLPLAMLEEIYPPAPGWRDRPAAYLQLSEPYERQAATARELGWPVATAPSHHLALLTDPEQVAGALHDLISQLPD
jgi:pimeloyl-ACP methyl ester carboxylesterase